MKPLVHSRLSGGGGHCVAIDTGTVQYTLTCIFISEEVVPQQVGQDGGKVEVVSHVVSHVLHYLLVSRQHGGCRTIHMSIINKL